MRCASIVFLRTTLFPNYILSKPCCLREQFKQQTRTLQNHNYIEEPSPLEVQSTRTNSPSQNYAKKIFTNFLNQYLIAGWSNLILEIWSSIYFHKNETISNKLRFKRNFDSFPEKKVISRLEMLASVCET